MTSQVFVMKGHLLDNVPAIITLRARYASLCPSLSLSLSLSSPESDSHTVVLQAHSDGEKPTYKEGSWQWITSD